MISVLSVDRQIILAATALMPSVMAVMNLATLPQTTPTRFLHQEHCTTMADLIQGIHTPTTGGKDQTPIIVQDIEDTIANHSPCPIHTTTEAAALEGTPHAPLPANAAACAAIQLMDAPGTLHTVKLTGIVAPHPAFTISPTGTTHGTPPTRASLTPAAPTTQHRILCPGK